MASKAQRERLRATTIVALDVDTQDEALALVDALSGWVDLVKVGSRMFTKYGPAILDALHEREKRVFLDLKFHDIPSVVSKACAEAAAHPAVFLMTVHASGGSHMIASAVEGANTRASSPDVVAVTALTSLSPAEMRVIGVSFSLEDWAEKLAVLAKDSGADGIVCSATEVGRLRGVLGEMVFVTPGIRPGFQVREVGDDQSRVMTPRQALDAGSTYLVIGRPLYQAADPLSVAKQIAETL